MKYLVSGLLFGLLLVLIPSCCWKKHLKRCTTCDIPIEKITSHNSYQAIQDSIDLD